MGNIKVKKYTLFNKDLKYILDQIDINYPIDLSELEVLIDRIYRRYPLISKKEISIIILNIFKSIRYSYYSGLTFIYFHNKFILSMNKDYSTKIKIAIDKIINFVEYKNV